MLQKLNERIQGLVAWVIITLVTLTFLLFGIEYYLQSQHDSSTKVEVNGQPITQQNLDLSYKRAYQLRDSSKMSAASEKQLKQQILNELIVNKVNTQAAISNGFEVTSKQADAAIVGIPQFQQKGHFSSDRYSQALNNAFYTPESFQNQVKQGMLLNQQRFALIGTSFVLPQDVDQFIKLSMQTRDYRYLEMPANLFLDTVKVTDAEVKDYYDHNKKLFMSPEKISIEYIRLSLEDIKKSVHITDAQIQQYYDENPALKEKPLNQVESEIKEQLTSEIAQAQYAEVLEKLSDLSYQTPDTLTPIAESLQLPVEKSDLFTRDGAESTLLKNKQVLQAAFSQDVFELGNNSELVQLDNDSVIVLRVNQHVKATLEPLDEVKLSILKKLVLEKAKQQSVDFGQSILKMNEEERSKTYKTNNLQWKVVHAATRDNENAVPLINDAVFRLSKINEKQGIVLPNGNYVIVELKAIHDGNQEALDNEQIGNITQQIEANLGVMDYELYVSGLMAKAKIVKNF